MNESIRIYNTLSLCREKTVIMTTDDGWRMGGEGQK